MGGICDLFRSLVHTVVDVIVHVWMHIHDNVTVTILIIPLRVLTATVSLAESLLSKPSYTTPNSPV